MATKRDVSVIIPTYNRSAVLRHSVESVLNQTYPVQEVIIVDDGSTDDTSDHVEQQKKLNPLWRDRVRYIYQSNRGQSVANNTGIRNAQGDWLGFNANDDLWLLPSWSCSFGRWRNSVTHMGSASPTPGS